MEAHPLAPQIDDLASMPDFLDAALDAVPKTLWTRRGADEGFSLTEQACHLRDLEREAFVVRVKRILDEDQPSLAGFDGTAVAAERRYVLQDAKRAAQEFAVARRELIALLESATTADLARGASFMGERTTLERLVGLMVEHDREHRHEIAALREALHEGEAQWR